jgi:hypothetical protein
MRQRLQQAVTTSRWDERIVFERIARREREETLEHRRVGR